MSEGYEHSGRGKDVIAIPITCGDRQLLLTRENTFLRTFEQGDGEYNHCVFIDNEGNSNAFKPSQELCEAMENFGFHIKSDKKIDQATVNFYTAWQSQRLDEELKELS